MDVHLDATYDILVQGGVDNFIDPSPLHVAHR